MTYAVVRAAHLRVGPAVLAAAILATIGPARIGHAASFQGVTLYQANTMSADGGTIVGYLSTGPTVLWTAASGIVGFNNPNFIAAYPSADGSIVVGSQLGESARWSLADGVVPEGCPNGPFSDYCSATAVSSDGHVMAGGTSRVTSIQCPCYGIPGCFYDLVKVHGFVQPGPGAQFNVLDPLNGYHSSQALAVSADGTLVVGASYGDNSNPCYLTPQACFWINGGPPIPLGYLPGQSASAAHAVSADGSTIVGYSGYPARAFRWTSGGGMVDLGDVPGCPCTYGSYTAMGVSADGSTIVGFYYNQTASGLFIWDDVNGMRDLRSVLIGLGLNLDGWMLDNYVGSGVGISADGLRVFGNGVNPAGQFEAWLAYLGDAPPLPCPADITPPGGDGAVNVGDLLTIINSWGPCFGCDADIDNTGIVNASDLLAVINTWGPCP